MYTVTDGKNSNIGAMELYNRNDCSKIETTPNGTPSICKVSTISRNGYIQLPRCVSACRGVVGRDSLYWRSRLSPVRATKRRISVFSLLVLLDVRARLAGLATSPMFSLSTSFWWIVWLPCLWVRVMEIELSQLLVSVSGAATCASFVDRAMKSLFWSPSAKKLERSSLE